MNPVAFKVPYGWLHSIFASIPADAYREIRWYGIAMALTMVVASYVTIIHLRKRKLDADLFVDSIVPLIVSGIIGARIVYVFTNMSEYMSPINGGSALGPDFGKMIALWEGGISFHGAIILGAIAALIFYNRKHVTFYQVADASVPGIALGIMLVRIGNFMNGDITGWKVSKNVIPWAMSFPYDEYHWDVGKGGNAAEIILRHPTEVYGFLVGLILAVILFYLYNKKCFDGCVLWNFVLGYSLIRSIIEEPFRAVHWHWDVYNNTQYGIKMFTMTQLISIPLILISIIMLVIAAKQHKKNMALLAKKGRDYYELASEINNIPLPGYVGNPKNDTSKQKPGDKVKPKSKSK